MQYEQLEKRYFYQQSDGTFKDDLYTYCRFDCMGQEISSISFSWDDLNDNGIHDEKDEYLYEDKTVTQDQWNIEMYIVCRKFDIC